MRQRLLAVAIVGLILSVFAFIVALGNAQPAHNTNNNLEVANVKDYGARGDGQGNDTAAIQKAMDYSTGSVYFPPGTYNMCGVNVPSDREVWGAGGTSILKSNCPHRSDLNLLNVVGTVGTNTELSADVALGDRQIAVDSSAGYSAEEVVFLEQSSSWAEAHRIKSIDDATHITFYEGIQYPFLIDDDVMKGTWKKNVNIRDLSFEGTILPDLHTTDRYEDHGVSFQKAYNVSVRNCSFRHMGSRAIIFIDRTANARATGNFVEMAYDRGIESHTRTSNNIISDNIISGGLVAISCQGIGTVCTGNRSFGQHGFDANDVEHGHGLYLASAYNAVVTGNSVGSSWDVCMPVSNAYRSIIANNIFSKCQNHGIAINSSNYLSINANSFFDYGSSNEDAAIHFYSDSQHVTVNGNRFVPPPSDGTVRRAINDDGEVSYLTVGLNFFWGFEFKEISLTTHSEDIPTERLAMGSPLTIYDGDGYSYTGGDWVPGRMEVNGMAKAKGQLFTQTAAPTLLNGECTMALTSDTNVKVTCKGSDATVRNADITIAP